MFVQTNFQWLDFKLFGKYGICKEMFANYLHTTRPKKFANFFPNNTLVIAKHFAYLKCYSNKNVLHILFVEHFYFLKLIQPQKNCCKFAIFRHIFQVEHKSFPIMYHLTYLDIKNGGFEAGGHIDPTSPVNPGFKLPQQGQD